ncbi:MAG TPA: hypothetical protein VMM60_01175 [Ilumatobacter sp.]|nr:hypothetical protein [Ilumatobacter sp.]
MSTTESSHLLRIYLEDHLAGGVAGTRRASRLAEAEEDGPDGATLTTVADEIELDLTALRALIDHLGVSPRAYKRVLARAAEAAGLMKLNGRLFSRSPLTTLVEVEMMLAAVRGKLAGWDSLRAALGTSAVGPVNLDELAARARSQLDALSAVHQRAAVAALGGASTG